MARRSEGGIIRAILGYTMFNSDIQGAERIGYRYQPKGETMSPLDYMLIGIAVFFSIGTYFALREE